MAGKTVAVLGGGIGGLVAANRLRKLLPREHRVVLIDRSVWHSLALAYTTVMLGRKVARQIGRDLRRLNRKRIEFIAAEITGIDLSGKTVRFDGQELTYDYLIVSLGTQYSVGEISGLGTAYTYYTLEGAEGLREEIANFTSGRIAIVVAGLPYKCPAAPYEGALLLDHYFRRQRLRADVEIRLFTPEPAPLPVAGEAIGSAVTELLAGREIWFSPNARLQAVDPQGKKLVFLDGLDASYDLLIAVPLHEVPTVVREAGLAEEEGWVKVDRETMATTFEGVYAIGDVTQVSLASGLMLPKAGVFAHGEAEVVARNIAAEIKGGKGRWDFGGEGGCFLETGYGKAAKVTGNFYTEPDPEVRMRQPSFLWRWEKEGFIRTWLWRWF
ncbi:MAG: NAD(P)/FAD-dependent oxidoreductase [Dehalococcoidia bacterium]|nr:MAG: NAD(P)/FAD-dependent oxidoreductase [Dehalococcoidia bacterium]